MVTSTGYVNLRNAIAEHGILAPTGKSLDELREWLEGYTACLDRILELITDVTCPQ